MAAAAVTYESLCRQMDKGEYAPIYLLHGEEGYYIDALATRFENILDEQDREFNLHVLYAPEVEMGAVMDLCYQYPMMADRQIVILKEAQAVKADVLNKLHRYASQPAPTTVFVICCRGAAAKGKDLISAVKANGVIFESKPLYESNVPGVISEFIKNKGLTADRKSLQMLCDYVGTDLSRLYNEIDKLTTIVGEGGVINPEVIEKNIGMSKDYNNFELINAISVRDAKKIFTIADYFKANPKNNPLVVTAATIFGYFADLLAAFYAPDRSDATLVAELKLKNSYHLGKYRDGMRNYNPFQIIEIISAIRRYDAMSKGLGSRQTDHQLFRDLLYHILTAPGKI